MGNLPPPHTFATPVWAEGYGARLHGLSRQENPYLNAADAREDLWDDGWLFADAEIAHGRLPTGYVKKKAPANRG